eukprot:m.1341498 g.1341498  ORF g.1341498 m.1341498 type:complete len:127 (-) comp24895_c0_seq7:7807-8187(-)
MVVEFYLFLPRVCGDVSHRTINFGCICGLGFWVAFYLRLACRYEQVAELERQVEDATRTSAKKDTAQAETTITDLRALVAAKDDEVHGLKHDLEVAASVLATNRSMLSTQKELFTLKQDESAFKNQ